MKKTLKDIMKEIEVQEASLIKMVVVFESPISGDLEYRVAYFLSEIEASIWEDRMRESYASYNMKYEVYKSYLER